MSNKLLYPIHVETYSGYKHHEQPRHFRLLDRKISVVSVIDRWYQQSVSGREGTSVYFRVRGSDRKLYLLKNDLETSEWFCVFNEADFQPRRRGV